MEHFFLYFMLCFLGYIVASTLWQERSRLGMILDIYSGSGIRHYLTAFGLALGMLIVAVTLYELAPGFMRFSWLQLFFTESGEGGSALSRPLVNMQDAGVPFALKLGLILVYTMLLTVMPYIVWSEERIFRAMRFTPWARLQGALFFGLSHMIIGVPFIIALVLAIPGYIFSGAYLKGFNASIAPDTSLEGADYQGLMSSTRLHTLYNASIISIVMFFALLLFLIKQ